MESHMASSLLLGTTGSLDQCSGGTGEVVGGQACRTWMAHCMLGQEEPLKGIR